MDDKNSCLRDHYYEFNYVNPFIVFKSEQDEYDLLP